MKKVLLTAIISVLTYCILNTANAQNDPITLEEPAKTEIEQLQDQVESNTSEIKKLKKFKVSGYIQGQFEVGQEFAVTKVGNPTSFDSKRDGKSGDFFRFGIHCSGITKKTLHFFATKKYVFRNGKIRDLIEFLVNRRYTELYGLERRKFIICFALKSNCSLCRAYGSGKHFNQCRLTRPVFTD